MANVAHPVIIDHLSYRWPDGEPVLVDANLTLGPGLTGIVGSNGSGKSTLLRLVAGQLQPTSGSIEADGIVAMLPQILTSDPSATVGGLLGVGEILEAIRAVSSGDPDPRNFEVIGNDWDVVTRCETALAAAGLGDLELDRGLRTISGGEATAAALVGLQIGGATTVLLDEPTNNLDRRARRHVYDAIESWRGTVLVVSHDVELLERMDRIVEVRDEALRQFGGNYSAYREQLAVEQSAAEQAVRTGRQQLRSQERQQAEAEVKLARRARMARRSRAEARRPPIVANKRRGDAEISAAKLRRGHAVDVDSARQGLDAAEAAVRDDGAVAFELPTQVLASSRRILTLSSPTASVELRGAERVGLVGANGIGKTRLVERMVRRDMPGVAGADDASAGHVTGVLHIDAVGYLPQRIELDEGSTALELVAGSSGTIGDGDARSMLAQLLLRGDSVFRRFADLSGGERFRVALATLLAADPHPSLLVLDEPTNNLDLDTVDVLVSALSAYRGALLVISHDDAFLARLGLHRTIELTASGLQSVVPASGVGGNEPR